MQMEVDGTPLSMLGPTLVTAAGIAVLAMSGTKVICAMIRHAVPSSF